MEPTNAIIITMVAISALVLLLGFKIVPAMHYGVIERFGERQTHILSEGLNWVIPWIDRVYLFEMENDSLSSIIMVTDKDKIEIEVKSLMEFRPTLPECYNESDEGKSGKRPVLWNYLQTQDKTLHKGLEAGIKSLLSKLAGHFQEDSDGNHPLINDKEKVELMVNCLMRLKGSDYLEDHPEAEFSSINSTKEWLELEEDSQDYLRKRLEEAGGRGSRSEIELRYGIDIVQIYIEDIGFTPDVTKARQAKKIAQSELEASKERRMQIVENIEKLRTAGASNQSATIIGTKIAGIDPGEISEQSFLIGGGIQGLENVRDINISLLTPPSQNRDRKDKNRGTQPPPKKGGAK